MNTTSIEKDSENVTENMTENMTENVTEVAEAAAPIGETKTTPRTTQEDCCCICLDELPSNSTKFVRWTCCGKGMHRHCEKDLDKMGMGDNCPLCRAKTPTSQEEMVKYLRPWATKKKAWAQQMMGQCYYNGKGLKQSYKMARRMYKLSSRQGYVPAMYNLGLLYQNGDGVEQSYEKAVEYFSQGAHLGDDRAQFNLGIMYANGEGIENNHAKAREWWDRSAAQGNEGAIKYLQIMNEEEGRTTTTTIKTKKTCSEEDAIVCSSCSAPSTEHKLIRCPCHSVQYCNKLCQKNHRKQHKKECHRLLAKKKLKKERNTTKTTTENEGDRKEEQGDECPICLEVLPKDATQFSRWTCCGNGIHNDCFKDMQNMKMSGTCPFCRAKTPTSYEEQVNHLRPWVKKKKAWAMAMMGQHYKDGTGVKQSYEMARNLFELAVQQGDATAMFNLGVMYTKGEGVEVSYERSKEYYEQAADLGDAFAMFNLGLIFEKGDGVEQS